MKDFFIAGLVIFIFIAVILGVAWMVEGNGFFMYKMFAPRMESVRRDTFKNSQAYNDGMLQDLQNLRREYMRSKDTEDRAVIASTILQRSAAYPEDRLPEDLRSFIDGLSNQP